MTPLETFRQNLPAKPYCTDELGYLIIRSLETAIRKRYIQPNKPTDLRWLVYDIDRADAGTLWMDTNTPIPNIITLTPSNGHGHYLYGLEVPVYLQHGSRENPYRYAAAIDIALTRELDADQGYAKLITKNPLHESWSVAVLRDKSYTLDELATHLDLGRNLDRRSYTEPVGLGRNCHMFDRARKWAYKAFRKGGFQSGFLRHDFWDYKVWSVCQGINMEFTDPLPESEVKATAKSISKWTWKHFSRQGWKSWHLEKSVAGGRKRGVQLTTERENRVKRLIMLMEDYPDLTQTDYADMMGVSRMSISSYVKQIKNVKAAYIR